MTKTNHCLVREATKAEIAKWDEYLIANPDGGNIFASFEFAEQKKLGGYTPRFIFVDELAVTVLEKHTITGFKLWYLPKGPGVTETSHLFEVLTALKSYAKKRGVFALRIETEFESTTATTLTRHGLKKADPIIPNPSTITLDLKPSLESIMETMPQKGRHAIKRAEREGIRVTRVAANKQNRELMYELLRSTADGRFGIRSKEYFMSYWQRFEKSGHGQLFFAYDGDAVIAGAYAHIFGTKSTYKDGASVRKKTIYGAPHNLQWEVIKWAKSRGSLVHDLCGAPPSEHINNPDHPHYGIGLFKTAFNRTVTDYIGCYDYVIMPGRYALWVNFFEKVAKRLHFQRYGEVYY